MFALRPATPRVFPALEHVQVSPRRVMEGCADTRLVEPDEFRRSRVRTIISSWTFRPDSPERLLAKCGLNRHGWTDEQIRKAFAQVGEELFAETKTVTPLKINDYDGGAVGLDQEVMLIQGQTIELGKFLAFAINSDVKLLNLVLFSFLN